MEKFISVEKMSKKQKKEYYKSKRQIWEGLSPITRVVKSKKVYDRKKQSKNLDCYFIVC